MGQINPIGQSVDRPSPSDACERCGSIAFLARATELAGEPALCVECHEALGTLEAQGGHQCLGGCPRPVDHDGLCLPY